MCGITGWVDFERDLTAERPVLEAMTRTMACRGPDASGYWAVPHAACCCSIMGGKKLSTPLK